MKVFHRRTKNENIHMLWQSLLVFVIMFTFMYVLKHVSIGDSTLGAIGATSLGSSAFLAFVAHDTAMARERRMIFGYLWGILLGVLGSQVMSYIGHCDAFHCQVGDAEVLVAAATAMVTMLCMTLTSSEHPPAVGIAIGLVLRQWDTPVLITVFATVLLIAIIKSILRPWLLNLL